MLMQFILKVVASASSDKLLVKWSTAICLLISTEIQAAVSSLVRVGRQACKPVVLAYMAFWAVKGSTRAVA